MSFIIVVFCYLSFMFTLRFKLTDEMGEMLLSLEWLRIAGYLLLCMI